MVEFTMVDLFSGSGGASLGFRDEGFKPVLGLDIDEDSAMTYFYNFRSEVIIGDAREYHASDIRRKVGDVDVLIGCPPCQGFTRLRRKESQDPRNDLVIHFGNLAAGLKPKILVFENVPGILKGKNLEYFQKFLRTITKVGYGYRMGILNAADYGVPQRRKRIILLASRDLEILKKLKLPERTHSHPRDSKHTGLPPWKTVRDVIADLLALEAGEAELSDSLHVARKHTKRVLDIIKSLPKDGGSRKDIPPELVLACHRKNPGFNDVYGRMTWNEPAPTLTSGCSNPSKGRFIHPEQDRGITLREAARIQTFPDGHVFFGNKTSIEYQIGNALPPLFSKKIAESVRGALVGGDTLIDHNDTPA